MYLRQLELIDFRNFESADVAFGPEVNCLTGPNGAGKTNLLDAVHYLSMCRSYFTATDVQNIRHGAPFFMVKGLFDHGGDRTTVACSVQEGRRKQFLCDGKPYARMHEHIGRFPVVMIAPADQQLVTGGSSERRRFMDRIVAQVDRDYLESLMAYQRVLDQRNALLRQAGGALAYDDPALQVWNEQLVLHGNVIGVRRRAFLADFNPLFDRYYRFVSGDRESAAIGYHTQVEAGNMEEGLQAGFEKDRLLRFTATGVHKDDLVLTLDGHSARKYGSQGQQKSVATALKLAQYEYVSRGRHVRPVVMLDDLFDKLDDDRVARIIGLVRDHAFGQLFISDTHPERVFRFLKDAGVPFHPFAVSGGRLTGEKTYA